MRESGDPRSRSSSLASIASRTGFGRRNVSSSDSLSKYTYICIYIYVTRPSFTKVNGGGGWEGVVCEFRFSSIFIGPGRLQDFSFFFFSRLFFFFLFVFCSAAAHLRNFGEHFTQDTDRPFAP